MSSPLSFFQTFKPKILALVDCHFNMIELNCPNCEIKQWYHNTEICGDKSIVCDYCSFDIPISIEKIPIRTSARIVRNVRTVIARI